MSYKPPVKSNPGKRRNIHLQNSEGYNSEDEHIRPRVTLDEKLLKYVEPDVLALKLGRKGIENRPNGKRW